MMYLRDIEDKLHDMHEELYLDFIADSNKYFKNLYGEFEKYRTNFISIGGLSLWNDGEDVEYISFNPLNTVEKFFYFLMDLENKKGEDK